MMKSSSELNTDPHPHPEALARLFIRRGDKQSALEVCRAWRRREPDSEAVETLRSELDRNYTTEDPPPQIDEALGEQYITQGMLTEALLIYRVIARETTSTFAAERLKTLDEFFSFTLPDDAPPLQRGAEEQLELGRLSVALPMYYELCEVAPELQFALSRLATLRALLGTTTTEAASESESFDDTFDGPTPLPEEAVEPPPPPRSRARAHTERSLTMPIELRQSSDREAVELDDIDPLGETQQLHLSDLEPPKRNKSLAQTIPSLSPMVMPDENGSSVVEIPTSVPNVFERGPHRPSSVEAAEIAEPLGVLVRPVIVIEQQDSLQ